MYPESSTLEAKDPINVHDVYTYIIHLLNGTLSTFRIYAEKKLRICIKAKLGEGISYVFIDSPIITLSSSLYSKDKLQCNMFINISITVSDF